MFDVNDVNKWLEKNNYLPENNLNNFNGWYHLTINQIKRAINAVKNQEDYCDIDTEIKLTINETNAIKSALNWWEKQNRFFWIFIDESSIVVPTLILIKKTIQINLFKFNHVLIVGSNSDNISNWLGQFNKLGLESYGYHLCSEENNNIIVNLEKSNLNADKKFICYLNFYNIEKYRKYIAYIHWDLIAINQLLDENISTGLENIISESSPDSKWLYFSENIPIFFLDFKGNKNCNDLSYENKIKSISSSSESVSMNEKIYLTNSVGDIDLLYSKPEELVIYDYKVLCHSWKDVLSNICNFLYQKYGIEFIKKIPHKDWNENKNIFRYPRQISNSKYWIETNYSSEAIYAISQDFLKMLNIPLDKVYLIIKRGK